MSQVKIIKTVSGRGIPVVGNDIDTDRIIPARYLRCVTFEGLKDKAFIDDRAQTQGQHPFDLPQYKGANILVVNGNFGCGSSREHAPQALAKSGIEVIVGESFAEIFFGNCVVMGIPCVTADADAIKQLQTILKENPQASITVDLEVMQVRCEDFQTSVSMGEGSRQMLTTGTWDTCGQLMTQVDKIHAAATKLPYIAWDTGVVVTAR
ncbi:MAG TPA: 3-isopropylmalate dehydratase small subunit [Cyanobacteria bacterium UBA11162]|nr:3-isopropylmalate dehydratase small subunit [Cyanobacteria bacterium UBA11162]